MVFSGKKVADGVKEVPTLGAVVVFSGKKMADGVKEVRIVPTTHLQRAVVLIEIRP